MRVCAVNATSVGADQLALARCRSAPWPAPRSSDPRASRRRGSRAARRRPAPARSTPLRRDERVGLPVAEGDRAGLVEQQRVDSRPRPRPPGRSSRARCGAPAGPCPRCRWPRAARRSSSGSGTRAARRGSTTGCSASENIANGWRRDGREQEDDREPGEQDVERDLVRRLLARRALDEGDHPVDERLARVGR